MYHMGFLKRSLPPDFPETPAYPRTISSEMLLLKLTLIKIFLIIHVHIYRILFISCTNKGKKAQILTDRIIEVTLSNNNS